MKIFARTIAALSVTLLGAAPALADLDDIRRAAEAGDSEAQLELGILFQYGFNYQGNEIPALTWYLLSANQGNAKAVKLADTLKSKMAASDVQEATEQMAKYTSVGKPAVTPTPGAAPSPEPPAAAPEPAPATPEAMPTPTPEAK